MFLIKLFSPTTMLCLGLQTLFANTPIPISSDDDILFRQETRQFFVLSDEPLRVPPSFSEELSVSINKEEPTCFYFFAERPQTYTQAEKRYEKNKASANYLHGYRVPFEKLKTWTSGWEEHAVADIRAKYMLINELLSPSTEKLSLELAEKQFLLAEKLFWDFKRELPYKRFNYEPILALKNVGTDNPAQKFAKYLTVRQDLLAKVCKKLRLAFRNGVLRCYDNDAKKVYDLYDNLFYDEHRRDSLPKHKIQEKLSEIFGDSLLIHDQLTFLVWFLREEPIPDDLKEKLPRLIENLNEYIQTLERLGMFDTGAGAGT